MKFMANVQTYIQHFGFKQQTVAQVAGIEKSKFARLLRGDQGATESDMAMIAKALDKEITYFINPLPALGDSMSNHEESTSIAFSMGEPDAAKVQLANEVFELLENVEAIMSVSVKSKQLYEGEGMDGF